MCNIKNYRHSEEKINENNIEEKQSFFPKVGNHENVTDMIKDPVIINKVRKILQKRRRRGERRRRRRIGWFEQRNALIRKNEKKESNEYVVKRFI